MLKKFSSFSKKHLRSRARIINVANRICVAADLRGEGRGYNQIAALHPAAHDGRWCQICHDQNGGTRLAIPSGLFGQKVTISSK
jgi:hypothetical protein